MGGGGGAREGRACRLSSSSIFALAVFHVAHRLTQPASAGKDVDLLRGKVLLCSRLTVTIPRHKCGLSLTNNHTTHKQTRENTQQLNISVQLFITIIRLKITYFKYHHELNNYTVSLVVNLNYRGPAEGWHRS